jgi:hypothetical protein
MLEFGPTTKLVCPIDSRAESVACSARLKVIGVPYTRKDQPCGTNTTVAPAAGPRSNARIAAALGYDLTAPVPSPVPAALPAQPAPTEPVSLGIVWLLLAISDTEKRRMLTVDEYGRVSIIAPVQCSPASRSQAAATLGRPNPL